MSARTSQQQQQQQQQHQQEEEKEEEEQAAASLRCSYNFMTAEPKRSTEFSCFCGIWIFVRLQNCRVVLHVSCEVEITIFLPSGGDGAIFGAQRYNIYICIYICYQRAESDVPRMRYNAAIAEVRTINQQQQTTTTSSSSPFFHQPGCFRAYRYIAHSRAVCKFASCVLPCWY